MLGRVVRAILGTVLLLAGLPLLLAGAALWFAIQHQDPAGGYTAALSTVTTDGSAVVASDIDGLLRQEVPFARGGHTTLRISAHTEAGPAFIGLAPASAVARYLADVPYAKVDQVRPARGPLPVVTTPIGGAGEPAGPPAEQSFWTATSRGGTLEWRPHELRGQQLALVVMSTDGAAPFTVDISVRVHPHWLASTTFGLLVLGLLLVLVALAVLVWPSRSRELVYVVPPAQLPQVAAHLGIPLPRQAISATAEAASPVDAPAAATPPPADRGLPTGAVPPTPTPPPGLPAASSAPIPLAPPWVPAPPPPTLGWPPAWSQRRTIIPVSVPPAPVPSGELASSSPDASGDRLA